MVTFEKDLPKRIALRDRLGRIDHHVELSDDYDRNTLSSALTSRGNGFVPSYRRGRMDEGAHDGGEKAR